jgi:hypothetical protein
LVGITGRAGVIGVVIVSGYPFSALGPLYPISAPLSICDLLIPKCTGVH